MILGVIQSVVSLCLVALAGCQVQPLSFPGIVVTNQDKIQINLTSLFNFGGVSSNNVTCNTYQSAGNVVYYNTSIFTRSLPVNYTNEPEVVNFISNTTLFTIFDNTNVMIQSINLDAESFGPAYTVTIGTPGIVAVCTDAVLNPSTNRLYIVCMTNVNQTLNKYIYMYEVNVTNGQLLNSFSVPQLENSTVQHRTQITIVPTVNRRGTVTTYVLVYDQGISGGYGSTNQWALVLGGADSGNLYSMGYADLSSIGFKAMYDLFDVRGSVLITGKNVSTPVTAVFSMAYCQILISSQGQPTFNCSQNMYPAPFGTYYGYIGVFNTGQFIEINANVNTPLNDTISICDFTGHSWDSGVFIDTQNCKVNPTSNIPDDVSISSVDGNAHQVVINYVYMDSTYAGYTVENFDMRVGWWDLDDSLAPHYVPIGKSLIRVNSQEFDIFRMVPPYYFVDASTISTFTPLNIRVACTDPSSGKQITSQFSLTVMSNFVSNFNITNPALLPPLNAYQGGEAVIPIDPKQVYANGARAVANLPLSIQNLTTSNVIDNEFMNVEFVLNRGSDAFVYVRFADRNCVAKDIYDNLIFMQCHMQGPLTQTITCVETYVIPTAGSHIFLQFDIESVFGYVFVWGTDNDSNTTTLYFYDGNQTVITYTERSTATDCTVSAVNNIAYLVCSFYEPELGGVVRGWNITGANFASRDRLPDIFVRNSGREFFCPQHVEFDMDTSEMLEVFSYCPGQDQRILRYRYPPTYNRQTGALQVILVTSIPINFAYTNVNVCSMGSEYIIKSMQGNTPNLQSASMMEDRNQWNFGTLTDDMNVGSIQFFSCVRDAGAFTTFTNKGENSYMVTYYGNNQWQANHRAFTIFSDPSLSMYQFAHSYEFMGNILHVLTPPGGPMQQKAYAMTFIRRIFVDLRFQWGIPTGVNYNLNVAFTGNNQRVSANSNLLISAAITSAQVSVSSQMNGVPSGVVELENFVKISGPVSYAYISGTDSVSVIGRLSSLNQNYFPDRNHQYTFDWMYSIGTTTVALHRYHPGNTSIFTIFQNIETFVGMYQPADGVHTYHFANFLSDPQSILLVMSTATLSNSSLDFIVLKNNIRMGIGFSNDQISMSYDTIRVCNLQSSNPNLNLFLVAAHNSTDGAVLVFNVTVDGAYRITSTIIKQYTGIFSIALAAPVQSSQVFLMMVPTNNRIDVQFTTFSSTDGIPQSSPVSMKTLMPNGGDFPEAYPIDDIEARLDNSTAFYILMSSRSTNIYEIIYDTANPTGIKTYSYNKMPAYDGFLVDGNPYHIMFMAESTNPGDSEVRIDFFQRQSKGGDGNTYWTQHLDRFRPISMTTCPHLMSHVMLATPFPAMPLTFQQLRPMRLNFTGNPSDFSKATLNIVGASTSNDTTLSISSIYIDNGDNGDGSKSGARWWIILLVAFGLLSAAGAIYYFRYGTNKEASFKESGNYQSMVPGAKKADL